jgi:hypothetical protein
LEEDPTTSYPDRISTFHGYSYTGNASAEYVYVGRGQQVDFERIEALGVNLTGKIALAKYGGPFRGLKVKNAQDHGMIGTVIFSDPGDDGNMTEAKGQLACMYMQSEGEGVSAVLTNRQTPTALPATQRRSSAEASSSSARTQETLPRQDMSPSATRREPTAPSSHPRSPLCPSHGSRHSLCCRL